MKLLQRYVGMTVMRAAALALLGLTLLIGVFRFIDEAEDIGEGSYRAVDALVVALSATPRLLYEAFPVAALLGALIGIGALAKRGELTAMRAAGVSQLRLLSGVLRYSLVFALVALLLGEVLAPRMDRFGEQYRLEKQQRTVSFRSANGFWAKDGDAFVNVRGLDPDGTLRNIRIYEFDAERQLRLLTSAQRATLEADGAGTDYRLQGILQTEVSRDGLRMRRLAEARWDSFLDPQLLRVIVVDPLMLPMWELYRFAEQLRANRQQADTYSVAFWTKVAMPLLTIGMLAITVPLAMRQERVGTGQRIFAGAIIGAGYYLLIRGFSLLVLVYALPPVLVALVPLVVIAITVVWLARVRL